jgi:hypothetical protein
MSTDGKRANGGGAPEIGAATTRLGDLLLPERRRFLRDAGLGFGCAGDDLTVEGFDDPNL